jgi:hypothetical protein
MQHVNSIKDIRLKMDDANISGIQRFLKTMDYKRLSKLTYKKVVVGRNQSV